MAKFITGKELTNAICEIIKSAKKELLIVSPYIKLDEYFKNHLFDKVKGNSDLNVIVAFGKNEKNPQMSFNKEDLDYFKEFPNIGIVYVPTLHAKYYANEAQGILTSVNLYDYSFDNNVEFGVLSENSFIKGNDFDYNAWHETMSILAENYAIYVRRPNFKKKLLGKDYLGSETVLDYTYKLIRKRTVEKVCVFDYMSKNYVNIEQSNTETLTRDEFKAQTLAKRKFLVKKLSATNLGKIKDKSYDDVIKVMTAKGYIIDKNTISEKGLKFGLSYKKNKTGTSWIVYPESFAEIL